MLGTARNTDGVLAMLLLRLMLGLRALFAGLEKFELQGTYSIANYEQTMTRMATGITNASMLPLWATRSFAMSLGYAFVVLGVALLAGIKTRITLLLLGLLFVGLAVGLMAVQESEGVAWIGVHVGLVVAALVLARHTRFALWPDRYPAGE